MDWFEALAGFREQSYQSIKSQWELDGEYLRSRANSRRYLVGRLELPTLAELRSRVSHLNECGKLDYAVVKGDARSLHRAAANQGALIQVASQFNLLEMVGPGVSPEDGITRYERDHTQGPACAIAAGAATVYRNYFVPVEGQGGQTGDRQLDALEDVRELLATWTHIPKRQLWQMKNGYPVADQASLETVSDRLRSASEDERDLLRSRLRIGLHWDVEVTDNPEAAGSIVSQAFCSAIPVSYSRVPSATWAPLAKLVLEAAYEATFAAGALNGAGKSSKTLFLTRLGGGAFGNPTEWIDSAIDRARNLYGDIPLTVRLVEYG